MRAGDFEDGAHVLRAKIDMSSPNMNMRDPTIYRIRNVPHHQTGDEWHIYPMYDFAHPISDSIEGITHSLCSMEYEDHRPLYDWFLDELGIYHPQQIEFARFNISHTVLSKRRLITLVEDGHVDGWDDPRMPTLAGLRRRGYTPEAIRSFCDGVGINRTTSLTEMGLLEHSLRDDLNRRAPRRMAVLNPLRVVIENFPEGEVDHLEAVNNPEDATAGVREVPFSRELYIDQDDFMEDPPRRFYRLAPGREVRLRYGYFIRCEDVVKDDSGEVVELRCTYDPETRGGSAPDGGASGPLCTGYPPSTPSTPRSGCTTACSPCRTPTTSRTARPGPTISTRTRSTSSPAASWSRRYHTRSRARYSSSSGPATSQRTGTRRQMCQSSTVPSRCVTPGPGSRSRVEDEW